jgi:hypothetical protein
MRRAIQVGFALVAIFSVALILITPTASDDLDGVLHPHHFHVSPPIARCQLHDLISSFRPSAEGHSIVDLRLDFLNQFCVRLC